MSWEFLCYNKIALHKLKTTHVQNKLHFLVS